MMRGTEGWMLDLMMSEEHKVNELLEYCYDATSQFVSLMLETGADMVSNCDSTSGPEIISAGMYEKYALPYEKKIAYLAHSKGVSYTLHICGDTGLILDKMKNIGADAIELDYKTDVQKIFKTCHDSITFIGNIDPSGVLALGNEKLVHEKTIELLEVYKNSNRFILNAGCAIPASTPENNIKKLIQTAREFT
jgi:MtaA/CmuA family methyltransferase